MASPGNNSFGMILGLSIVPAIPLPDMTLCGQDMGYLSDLYLNSRPAGLKKLEIYGLFSSIHYYFRGSLMFNHLTS